VKIASIVVSELGYHLAAVAFQREIFFGSSENIAYPYRIGMQLLC
jgi:hypothetical protein